MKDVSPTDDPPGRLIIVKLRYLFLYLLGILLLFQNCRSVIHNLKPVYLFGSEKCW